MYKRLPSPLEIMCCSPRDFVAARHAFRTAKEKIIFCMRNEVSEWTNQTKSAHICSSDILAVFVFEKEYGKQGKSGLCES